MPPDRPARRVRTLLPHVDTPTMVNDCQKCGRLRRTFQWAKHDGRLHSFLEGVGGHVASPPPPPTTHLVQGRGPRADERNALDQQPCPLPEGGGALAMRPPPLIARRHRSKVYTYVFILRKNGGESGGTLVEPALCGNHPAYMLFME